MVHVAAYCTVDGRVMRVRMTRACVMYIHAVNAHELSDVGEK